MEYGSVAEWASVFIDFIGVIATCLTIYLTLRHYSNDNKIDFRIMTYDRYESKEIDKGVTSISGEKNIHVSGINFGKNPELFRLEGFMKRESFLGKIKIWMGLGHEKIISHKIEFFPSEKVHYELVDSHSQSKEEVFSVKNVKKYLELNGFDLQNGFYIVYMHISGKRFKKLIKYETNNKEE